MERMDAARGRAIIADDEPAQPVRRPRESRDPVSLLRVSMPCRTIARLERRKLWRIDPDQGGRAVRRHFRSITMNPTATATAVLGGGCFWCLDAVFRGLEGVLSVESGYAGGQGVDPTYEQVCSGRTGHAEVVKVVFDPAVISYRDLLNVFFTIHDPTTKDRQGNDVGTQYRSVVFAQTPEQRAEAEAVIADLSQRKLWRDPIVTEIAGAAPYYPAEAYHQDYFAHHPAQAYCQVVIEPKVAKFRKTFADRLRRKTTA
jgi:peptide-methionine (S)-S-oxide reductase